MSCFYLVASPPSTAPANMQHGSRIPLPGHTQTRHTRALEAASFISTQTPIPSFPPRIRGQFKLSTAEPGRPPSHTAAPDPCDLLPQCSPSWLLERHCLPSHQVSDLQPILTAPAQLTLPAIPSAPPPAPSAAPLNLSSPLRPPVSASLLGALLIYPLSN